VLQFASFNLFTYAPFMVLGAVVARDRLGGAAAWGLILAALGAGNVVGTLVVVRFRPRRPLVMAALGAVPFALPVACTALAAGTALIAVCAGVAGAGLSVTDTLWETTFQQHVPAAVLSRVSSYDWFGSVAFVPVGYAVAGPLGVALGVRAALLFGAAWALVTCAAVLSAPSVRGFTVQPGAGAGKPSPCDEAREGPAGPGQPS
jgi:MFS family permease